MWTDEDDAAAAADCATQMMTAARLDALADTIATGLLSWADDADGDRNGALDATERYLAGGCGPGDRSARTAGTKQETTEQVENMSAPRFTLDETRARQWLKLAVKAYDYDNGGGGLKPETEDELPEIGADWKPRDFGEEYNADAVVRLAVTAGIIECPDGMDLYFEYVADDDGGCYRFFVYVGLHLTLASYSEERRKIGTPDAEGIAAAMAILREAVGAANGVLEALGEYVQHAGSRAP